MKDGANISPRASAALATIATLMLVMIGTACDQPEGGRDMQGFTYSCDDTLRSTVRRNVLDVDHADAVNVLISEIQQGYGTSCEQTVWDPKVMTRQTEGAGADPVSICREPDANRNPSDQHDPVRMTTVDRALRFPAEHAGQADGLLVSREGDIVLRFDDEFRPTDDATCWVYVAEEEAWRDADRPTRR